MSEARTLSTRYRVEPDMRIGWTSANWDRFARENGAPELTDGRVLGHPLWEYIEGDGTRAVYAAVIEWVRATGREIVLPFRCDSPDVRRFMELRMKPSPKQELEVVAELLREEPRSYVGLLDPRRPRAGEAIRICSFCKRVEIRGSEWLEVEDATTALELSDDAPYPPLDHSVCPDCEATARSESPE